MNYRLISFLSVFAYASSVAQACEGECIVSITKAFIGNYSNPIYSVLHQLVRAYKSPSYFFSDSHLVGRRDIREALATLC